MCSARANARDSIEHGIKQREKEILFFVKRVDNVRFRCCCELSAFDKSRSVDNRIASDVAGIKLALHR